MPIVQVDITGGPRQIVSARHALAARVAEWKEVNKPSEAPEDKEYSLKVIRPGTRYLFLFFDSGVMIRYDWPMLYFFFNSCLARALMTSVGRSLELSLKP